jgi:hypothetical protein
VSSARLFLLLAALSLVSCSAGAYSSVDEIPEDPAPSGSPGHFGLGLLAGRSHYAGEGASRSVRDLLQAMPSTSLSAVKVEYAMVYPSYLILRVYRGGVDFDDWIWREGSVEGPTPAHGTTARDAADVFDVSAVPWTKVPEIRKSALEAAALEGGRLNGLQVRSTNGTVQLAASVHGTRHDATITFDVEGHRIP